MQIQRQVNEPTTFPCPTCGGEMWWKQAKASRNWFMSCKKWPACSGTRNEKGDDSRISAATQNRLHRIIKAAVLASEDECLTFSSAQLEQADMYELHLDEITESKAFVVTVKRRG